MGKFRAHSRHKILQLNRFQFDQTWYHKLFSHKEKGKHFKIAEIYCKALGYYYYSENLADSNALGDIILGKTGWFVHLEKWSQIGYFVLDLGIFRWTQDETAVWWRVVGLDWIIEARLFKETIQ